MAISVVVLGILTLLLFQFGNPGASGGPATQTPLADQSGLLGFGMAITFVAPLVLGILYLLYGECGLCPDTKNEAVPTEEEGKAKVVNGICIAAAAVPVVVTLLFFGFMFFLNSDFRDGIQDDITNPGTMPFNGTENGTIFG